MSEKVIQQAMRYVVLMAGILSLLSVVVPHHHHRDGMPCYHAWTADHAQGEGDTDSGQCGCDGHNLAYLNSNGTSVATDGDADLYLTSLLILFDYLYPPELTLGERLVVRERIGYIESPHDSWIVEATGLRSPPVS